MEKHLQTMVEGDTLGGSTPPWDGPGVGAWFSGLGSKEASSPSFGSGAEITGTSSSSPQHHLFFLFLRSFVILRHVQLLYWFPYYLRLFDNLHYICLSARCGLLLRSSHCLLVVLDNLFSRLIYNLQCIHHRDLLLLSNTIISPLATDISGLHLLHLLHLLHCLLQHLSLCGSFHSSFFFLGVILLRRLSHCFFICFPFTSYFHLPPNCLHHPLQQLLQHFLCPAALHLL
ncbi:hypothetical protein EYF80_028590 [Liparis tanakae]|uniref:Uncharacterized protein n=1 Tax=Liparis tanakae TaxID=230148 RepID=A0A4Z2H7J4_9TELE|nr:hypothetical protein EYF80_028590 [Liparis tanakae]